MFFIISQVFSWIILPLNQILVTLGFSIFSRAPKFKRYSRYAFLFLLFWYTSPITSWIVTKSWEIPATPFQSVGSYEIAVVLTGMSNMRALPTDRPHFGEGADRITDAVTLYKMGKIKKLLISGGSGSFYFPELKESIRLRDFAVTMGVRQEDIFVEDNSVNTRQNAVHSMTILKNNWSDENFLLITSATHMRRALGCFKKAGGNPTVFSADIKTSPFSWDFRLLVPSAGSLIQWTTLTREIVGCIAYWLAGYI